MGEEVPDFCSTCNRPKDTCDRALLCKMLTTKSNGDVVISEAGKENPKIVELLQDLKTFDKDNESVETTRFYYAAVHILAGPVDPYYTNEWEMLVKDFIVSPRGIPRPNSKEALLFTESRVKA